jgi:molybdopterin molybdotransferase
MGGTSFETALTRVLGLVSGPLPAEHEILTYSVGRVLAEDVEARLNLPSFDQSAMDGYAVRCADLTVGAWLPVTGRTAAGEPPGVLAATGAHRILTGASLPFGADAVIPQEDVERFGEMIRISAVPAPGTNVRRRGEDILAGDDLIAAGTKLDWRHIAILASQGLAGIRVRRKPVVGLVSSGRELRGPGEGLGAGQIHDSNMPMLAGLLSAWGAKVRPVSVDDDPAAMKAALARSAAEADVVLTTAGISVGDEDHVRDALAALGGDLAVLKVAMKPGKPLAAGRLGNALFVGLPGNPQAALAGAVGFVRPLLARLAGLPDPAAIAARAAFSVRGKPGRAEFVAVRLVQRGACLWAERAGPDGSGRLAPLLRASALAFVPGGRSELVAGHLLRVYPFTSTLDLNHA